MAYNNYYQPMGYQPPSIYQPQYQSMQTVQQQPIQMPQAQTPNGIIWVNDYNEAAMYPVAPNSAVALWDKSSSAIYLKKSDMTGKPAITVYDLIERKEPPKQDANGQSDLYATKTDLQDVLNTVDGLKHQLNEMRLRAQNRGFEEDVKGNE